MSFLSSLTKQGTGPLLARAAGALLALQLGLWTYRWIAIRMMFRRLKAQGVPILPHSFLLGHLPVVLKLRYGLPADLHPNYLPQLIMEHWRTYFPGRAACPPVLYVDIWPLGPPVAFALDTDAAAQFLTEPTLGKAPNANRFLHTLTQNRDLLSTVGPEWRVWRTRFNPGFSAKNVTALAPAMLDDVLVFLDNLRARAGAKPGAWGKVFALEDLAVDLTLDVIGRATLDVRLGEQTTGPSVLHRALIEQISLCMFEFNVLTLHQQYSPRRHWRIYQNNAAMRAVLLPAIQARLAAGSEGAEGSDKLKTVLDLALRTYKEEAAAAGKDGRAQPDTEFIETVIAQLKVFLFAGHDTTATSICWILHRLAKHPEVADKVRAEHAAVFGADPALAADQIRDSPHLLNQLPYTLAVIKETLRLNPSVGPIRQGHRGFVLRVPGDAVEYPTDGFMVWDPIRASPRWDKTWVRPLEFLPERFLAAPEDELYPRKNAWRPFGLGPRACAGQELALTEMKMVMVLLARTVDVDCAWEHWDVVKNIRFEQIKFVEGHRCYQNGLGTPHTKEGMPVRVRLRAAPVS